MVGKLSNLAGTQPESHEASAPAPSTVFADESGTSSKHDWYGIGALVIRDEKLKRFETWLNGLKTTYGVGGELKWKDINTSYAPINLAIDLLTGLLKSSAHYATIVVHKASYRHWRDDPEKAFYMTYTQLLRDQARVRKGEYRLFFDGRDDHYKKQDEVVEIVTNNMLRKAARGSHVTDVSKVNSKLVLGVQAADVLTGAIVASHNLWLNPGRQINGGKRLLISRLARVLGWPDLCCDTYPNSPFNIWHFPREWRARPETRQVHPDHTVPHVSAAEMGALI